MDGDRSANLAQQTQLYGAPLGQCVRSVAEPLGLSQAGVARILGVSAPMLSQLMSGQRIKIGNPLAAQRLQALLRLAEEVRLGLPAERVPARLEDIQGDATGTLTAARAGAGSELPAAFTRLLRAVASGRELAAAADTLQQNYPDLAEVLRVYGTGGPEQAERHYASVLHLLRS